VGRNRCLESESKGRKGSGRLCRFAYTSPAPSFGVRTNRKRLLAGVRGVWTAHPAALQGANCSPHFAADGGTRDLAERPGFQRSMS